MNRKTLEVDQQTNDSRLKVCQTTEAVRLGSDIFKVQQSHTSITY